MEPFISSITLTDSNKITSSILESTVYSEIGNEVPGVLGKAMTSKGRPVWLWQANSDNSLRYKYFCYGFALDTYLRFGYSVCSGADILRVLEDDYVEIIAVQSAPDTIQLLKIGDIVSFANLSGKIIHTAKVFCLDINPSVPLRPIKFADIILSTKNGYRVACLQPILTTVRGYPETMIIRYWRPR